MNDELITLKEFFNNKLVKMKVRGNFYVDEIFQDVIINFLDKKNKVGVQIRNFEKSEFNKEDHNELTAAGLKIFYIEDGSDTGMFERYYNTILDAHT